MATARTILRKVARRKPYNILLDAYEERYDSALCATPHNFYVATNDRANWHKEWSVKMAPLPPNLTILPSMSNTPFLHNLVDIDLIICQNVSKTAQIYQNLSRMLEIPILYIEHDIPSPLQSQSRHMTTTKMRGGSNTVFYSPKHVESWHHPEKTARVILPGIDLDLFQPLAEVAKQNIVLTVANNFISKDYKLGYSVWKAATGFPTSLFDARIIGDTPRLSIPTKNVEELVFAYNSANVYFNPTTLKLLPLSVIEAMACGCPIVSLKTGIIPEYIQHEVNGLLANTIEELRGFCQFLLTNQAVATKLGQAARNSAEQFFGIDRFAADMTTIIEETVENAN